MGKIKALVTGGSGFLGQHLLRQLVDTGKYEAFSFDIREGPSKVPGVEFIQGDLRSLASVEGAIKGMEVVFHVATAAPTGAGALNKALMDGVNVEGTKNVIAACQAHGVKKLIYTSSASGQAGVKGLGASRGMVAASGPGIRQRFMTHTDCDRFRQSWCVGNLGLMTFSTFHVPRSHLQLCLMDGR